MPASVFLESAGTAVEVTALLNELHANVQPRGGHVMVEDPVALANGHGRLEVQFQDLGPQDARAVVRAILDQLRGAAEIFTIIDRPDS